jgi:hypothetical protein
MRYVHTDTHVVDVSYVPSYHQMNISGICSYSSGAGLFLRGEYSEPIVKRGDGG